MSDSYHSNSIKIGEREKRGITGKILLKSGKSKIPREFNKFLLNSENKQKMISILFNVMEEKRIKVMNILRTNKLVLAGDEYCKAITVATVEDFTTIVSNQEEADTKVVLHSHQALQESESNQILLRSPSGDTDILVLVLSILHEFKDRIVIDNGTGNSRKLIWLGSIEMSNSRINSLLGVHSFTGNDYVPSFFRKGKGVCWKILKNHSKFECTFSNLGNTSEVDDNLLKELEEFVCLLYGYSEKSVNAVRFKMFQKKQSREHKVADLSILPPCHQVLLYHVKSGIAEHGIILVEEFLGCCFRIS